MKMKLILMSAVLFSTGIAFSFPIINPSSLPSSMQVISDEEHAALNQVVPNQMPLPIVQPFVNQPVWMKALNLLGNNNFERVFMASSYGCAAACFFIGKDTPYNVRFGQAFWGLYIPTAAAFAVIVPINIAKKYL